MNFAVDITGQKFGRLTAIKSVGFNKGGNTNWLFRCDCGIETEKRLKFVLTGATKSCGCLKKEHTKDITGQKFGRLTAVKRIRVKGKSMWLFNCDCGNQKEALPAPVRNGHTTSCGCRQKECRNHTKHGESKTRLFSTWQSMKDRCNNSKSKFYKNYGGRGIKICEEWGEFIAFRDWSLLNGYSDNLSIDRINNDGNYEPSNCRFTTHSIQNRNKRNNVYIKINEETKTLTDWAEMLNIKPWVAIHRRSLGKYAFTPEEILKLKDLCNNKETCELNEQDVIYHENNRTII